MSATCGAEVAGTIHALIQIALQSLASRRRFRDL
jgi:hypothetical protein